VWHWVQGGCGIGYRVDAVYGYGDSGYGDNGYGDRCSIGCGVIWGGCGMGDTGCGVEVIRSGVRGLVITLL
jgi:hypothetical protein